MPAPASWQARRTTSRRTTPTSAARIAVVRRAAGEPEREQDDEQRQRPRPPRPNAVADELATLPVLLDGGAQPRGAERAEPNLDVPAVGVATAHDVHAPRAQDRARARAAARSATASARSRRSAVWATGRRTRDSPRRRHGVSPPRSRPAQTRDRLEQKQDGGHAANSRAALVEPFGACQALRTALTDESERSCREQEELDTNRRVSSPRQNRLTEDADDRQQREQSRSGGTTRASAEEPRSCSACGRRATGRGCCPRSRSRCVRVAGADGAGVHPALPGEMASAVVLVRPLPLEQRLGLPVLPPAAGGSRAPSAAAGAGRPLRDRSRSSSPAPGAASRCRRRRRRP